MTVGVVTPHSAPGPEVELPAMTGGRVATVLSRTEAPLGKPVSAHAGLRASTEPAALDHAAATMGSAVIAAVAHASTTAGYLIGPREEAALVDRLAQRFAVPAVASCAAVVDALRLSRIGTVQLVHPPWFDDEFDALAAAYFRRQGVDAVVTKAVAFPSDPARVEPQHVTDWVEAHVDDRADAVFPGR